VGKPPAVRFAATTSVFFSESDSKAQGTGKTSGMTDGIITGEQCIHILMH
jgi:hypothetical protein